jgi:hypothetical protein
LLKGRHDTSQSSPVFDTGRLAVERAIRSIPRRQLLLRFQQPLLLLLQLLLLCLKAGDTGSQVSVCRRVCALQLLPCVQSGQCLSASQLLLDSFQLSA